MKVELSRSKTPIHPRACFDLGQRVTEVGAAIAYASYFAHRSDIRIHQTVKDVSAGVHTAAVKMEELRKDLHGKARAEVGRLEKDLFPSLI